MAETAVVETVVVVVLEIAAVEGIVEEIVEEIVDQKMVVGQKRAVGRRMVVEGIEGIQMENFVLKIQIEHLAWFVGQLTGKEG